MAKATKPAKEIIGDTKVAPEDNSLPKKSDKSKVKSGLIPEPVNIPEVVVTDKVSETKTRKAKSTKPAAVHPESAIEAAPAPKKAKAGKPTVADNEPPITEAPVTAVAEPAADISVSNQQMRDDTKMETKQKAPVRYSDEDLDMFRERISEVRKEAIEELSMLKDRLEDLTNYDVAEESMIYSMHMAEQGSEFIEKEKTYAQIQRINEYIKKLDEALQRISEKTYGICRVCGCLIAKERLLAVPITTLSASYKIHKKCPEDGIDRIEPLK